MIGLVDNESRESLYAQQPQHPRASSSRRSRSKSAKASASGSRRGSYAPVSPLREQESGNGNAGRTSKNSRKEDVEGEGIPLRPYPYPTSGKRLKGKGVHDEHIRRDTEDEKSDDEGGDKEDTDDEDEDIEAGELEDLDPEDMASWVGQPHIRGSSESVRMALLTLSLVGLQFTWGIEMTCKPPSVIIFNLIYS